VSRAIAAGLTYRPLKDTVAATLDWWRQLPESRRTTLKFGLSAERELALLDVLMGSEA
jgi:2'-hydroxyisoflavone reductase